MWLQANQSTSPCSSVKWGQVCYLPSEQLSEQSIVEAVQILSDVRHNALHCSLLNSSPCHHVSLGDIQTWKGESFG